MGTSTCIEINKKWREPALLWLVFASIKGTNKSGALNLLSGALQEIEEMLAEKDDGDTDNKEDRHSSFLSITSRLKNFFWDRWNFAFWKTIMFYVYSAFK